MPDPSTEGRPALVARWLELTRRILPGMAGCQGWPIHLDHCFMRVLLDAAVGARWDTRIRRPAIRHADEATLRRAVALGEAVIARPELLPALNRDSLRMRRR